MIPSSSQQHLSKKIKVIQQNLLVITANNQQYLVFYGHVGNTIVLRYMNKILIISKMPMEDFEIKEDLGKGSFGSVVKVIRISDGAVYAMKQIKLQRLKQKDKKNALNQIRFLASIKHPNVASYRQAFYDEQTENLCVVMDFANEGDLSRKIKKHLHAKVRIKEQSIWKVAYQLLQGLNKLHESNIIHRDVKPANVFFHNGCAQIGDLNVAKHLKDPFTKTQTGTPYYASPEVWNQQPYDFKSDIWSVGCVLYEMACLKPPFRADSPDKLFKRIMTGIYDPLPSCYSKQLSELVKSMLSMSQKSRPTCKQLLCEHKMLEMKKQQEQQMFDNEELLKTIKFPPNLKQLNDKLPKPQYDFESPVPKSKTAKVIKLESEAKENSRKLIPIPSLKLIVSQKNIGLTPQKSIKDINITVRKPKILNKNGSQKLIF